MTAARCLSCGAPQVVPVWSPGRLPVCHRFLASPGDPELRFPLSLGQCKRCGLAQLTDTVPLEELLVGSDAVLYREPEAHLDDLVGRLCHLPGISPDSRWMGLTYKEDSALDRLRSRGFSNVVRPDAQRDLGAPNGGMAAIQSALDLETARQFALRHGHADVLVIRHILEHAEHPRDFLAACAEFVRPSGWLAFEVPDCARMFERLDYTTAWEEHTLYLTRSTFPRLLQDAGMHVRESFAYEFPREDSLIAFARKGTQPDSRAPASDPGAELARLKKFAEAFPDRAATIRRHLAACRGGAQRTAIFGAGHLSCLFLNVFGLADLVDFVIDDDPRKRGKFMPGTRLPIRDSSALSAQDVMTCLSSLSPESERKVLPRHAAFTARGGRFLSIFPGREDSIAP